MKKSKIFWTSWLAPILVASPVIYEELFGKLPEVVFVFALGGSLIMLLRPGRDYVAKRVSFGEVVLYGTIFPFLIAIILVFVNIVIVGMFSRNN